ncbi:hypothetical protein ACE6H2_006660 [Prunus campanulata]
MVSTCKQIEVSGQELVGPLISEKALRQKKKKAMAEGEGTDAKIASLVQQMEKMTLIMAKLVEDLARKPQDEIPEDKTSRTKTSKVKKRMQFSEEEEESAEEFGADQSQDKESDADKASKSKTSMNGLKIDVKIDIPVHVYDGEINTEKLDNWIDQLETYYTIYEYNNHESINFATLKLTKHALTWWKAYNKR